MNKQPAGRLFICIIPRFSPRLTTSFESSEGMMEEQTWWAYVVWLLTVMVVYVARTSAFSGGL